MRSRTVRLIDGALLMWVVVWIGLGVAIGIEMHRLTALANTVSVNGRAIDAVGRSLSSFDGLPLVGSEVARTGAQVRQAGQSAVASGQSSRSAIATLSVLLAVAVAFLPTVPVLTIYVPWRLDRQRRVRVVRIAVRDELSRLGVGHGSPQGGET